MIINNKMNKKIKNLIINRIITYNKMKMKIMKMENNNNN